MLFRERPAGTRRRGTPLVTVHPGGFGSSGRSRRSPRFRLWSPGGCRATGPRARGGGRRSPAPARSRGGSSTPGRSGVVGGHGPGGGCSRVAGAPAGEERACWGGVSRLWTLGRDLTTSTHLDESGARLSARLFAGEFVVIELLAECRGEYPSKCSAQPLRSATPTSLISEYSVPAPGLVNQTLLSPVRHRGKPPSEGVQPPSRIRPRAQPEHIDSEPGTAKARESRRCDIETA